MEIEERKNKYNAILKKLKQCGKSEYPAALLRLGTKNGISSNKKDKN